MLNVLGVGQALADAARALGCPDGWPPDSRPEGHRSERSLSSASASSGGGGRRTHPGTPTPTWRAAAYSPTRRLRTSLSSVMYPIPSERAVLRAALAHLWPLLAFTRRGDAGVQHIKSGPRRSAAPPDSLIGTMAVQAVAEAVIELSPASVPHSFYTALDQLSWSPRRSACSETSATSSFIRPWATTGNLVAFSGFGVLLYLPAPRGVPSRVRRVRRPDCRLRGMGALVGAVASRAWGVHAIWLPAGVLAITLCLFIIHERHLR